MARIYVALVYLQYVREHQIFLSRSFLTSARKALDENVKNNQFLFFIMRYYRDSVKFKLNLYINLRLNIIFLYVI